MIRMVILFWGVAVGGTAFLLTIIRSVTSKRLQYKYTPQLATSQGTAEVKPLLSNLSLDEKIQYLIELFQKNLAVMVPVVHPNRERFTTTLYWNVFAVIVGWLLNMFMEWVVSHSSTWFSFMFHLS
jgi:hypothetical protein